MTVSLEPAPAGFDDLDDASIMDHFELCKTEEVAERGITISMYTHKITGAEAMLVDAKDENKVFSANFRTLPKDDTGVPHILEHSVLCGSRRYPVKEPFVELLKGSLKTFLNAMTGPDKTMYPVASQNKQDFYNLANVYLDACLFPRILDPAQGKEILKQEGWHYEVTDVDAPLKYKGVVFNEMKGVYSSADQMNYRTMRQALFRGHPIYSIDSGGDPRAIPTLTYDAFAAFHSQYYHPSNGFFYMYADPDELPHSKRLALLQEYLKEYDAPAEVERIPVQPLVDEPYEVTRGYPADAAATSAPTQFVTLAWLLNTEPLDRKTTLTLSVLNDLLLGSAVADLQKPLLESRLGVSVIGGGFGTSLQQASFAVGLKGVATGEKAKEEVSELILSTLSRIADKGFDDDAIEASMNSMEFALRSSTASPMKGLSFGMGAVSAWNYERDPISPLRFADSLAALKQDVASSGGKVFVDLLKKYVLENRHRVTVALVPEADLAAQLEAAEEAELAAVQAGLSAEDRQTLLNETSALRAAQAAHDDPADLAKLPSLSTSDLEPKTKPAAPTEKSEISLPAGRGSVTLLTHDLPTDGIIYVDVALPLQRVDAADIPLLPLLGGMVSSLGTGAQDEVTFTRRVDAQTGGVGAGAMTTAMPGAQWRVGDRDSLSGYWILSGKATAEKAEPLFQIASEMLTSTDLNNPSRVVEMLSQSLAGMESSVVSSGNSYASRVLGARFSLAGHVDELMGGLSQMSTVREALAQAKEDFPTLLARLERMRAALLHPDGAIINLSADESSMAKALPLVPALVESLPCEDVAMPFAPWLRPTASGILVPTNEGLQVQTKVNYVAKACPIYEPGERISGATSVVTRYLGTSYLWDTVRVQGGAYGCSLGFGQLSGVATFSSYRDPNVANTLQAYDRTGDFLRKNPLSAEDLSKAIIGATGELDAPRSVSSKGYTAMIRHILGVSEEDRQIWRDEVLGTTAKDFVDFADRLDRVIDGGSVAVVASERAINEANDVLPEARRLEARRVL